MGAIEAGRAVVLEENRGVGPAERVPGIVVLPVHRLRPGVGPLDEETLREGPVQGHLQRVVVAAEVAVEPPQRLRAPELLEENLPGASLARARRVDVVKAHHLRRLGAHVGSGQREVRGQPPLVRQVPGLDVAAVEMVVIRRAHEGRRRQVHRSCVQVGSSEEGDARGERPERHEIGGARERLGDDRGVEAPERPREGHRTDRHAVSAAEHVV